MNPDTPEANPAPAQQGRCEGSEPAPCSRYGDVPETNGAILMCQDEEFGDRYGYFHAVHADVAAKLERERNEAKKLLIEITAEKNVRIAQLRKERDESIIDAGLFLQDLEHIKSMIEKGATTQDVLMFLDTPRATKSHENSPIEPTKGSDNTTSGT